MADDLLPTENSASNGFPYPDDWEGWLDIYLRADDGTSACVPECMLAGIAHLLAPDGTIQPPEFREWTPYGLAKYMHIGRGPHPPWHEFRMTPRKAKEVWDASHDGPDLYFIVSAGGPIKIGVSSDVEGRLRTLQTAHPYKLEVACVIEGGWELEPHYHARFAEHRLHGEWFSPHQDITDEIERLCAQGLENASGRYSQPGRGAG